jgi:hypothetical protein
MEDGGGLEMAAFLLPVIHKMQHFRGPGVQGKLPIVNGFV